MSLYINKFNKMEKKNYENYFHYFTSSKEEGTFLI